MMVYPTASEFVVVSSRSLRKVESLICRSDVAARVQLELSVRLSRLCRSFKVVRRKSRQSSEVDAS